MPRLCFQRVECAVHRWLSPCEATHLRHHDDQRVLLQLHPREGTEQRQKNVMEKHGKQDGKTPTPILRGVNQRQNCYFL